MNTQSDAIIYDRIALIGVGLIGGSVARAVRELGLANEVYGYSRRAETRDQIRELGLCDRVFTTAKDAVVRADLVILCTPVQTFDAIAAEIAPFMKAGATITDVGSVKGSVVEALEAHMPDHVNIVAGHPIAGTEYSGPDSGFAELFKDRWHILTPSANATVHAIEQLSNFWQAMGAEVEIMTPTHHDLVLATTSHVPHLIAYTLVGAASGMENSLQSEIIKFSAGGFRDSTRIAASDPTMWRDIFLTNPEAVLQVLGQFEDELAKLKSAITSADGDAMFNTFTQTRAVRKAIVEAGQAGHFDPRERDTSGLTDEGFLSMYGD